MLLAKGALHLHRSATAALPPLSSLIPLPSLLHRSYFYIIGYKTNFFPLIPSSCRPLPRSWLCTPAATPPPKPACLGSPVHPSPSRIPHPMGSDPHLSTQWVLVKAPVTSVELGSSVSARGPSCLAPQQPGTGPVPSYLLDLVFTGFPSLSLASPLGNSCPVSLDHCPLPTCPPNSGSLLGPLLCTHGLWSTCLEAPLLC